ncbi:MAG: hypothetical protein ISR65_09915 [Bacteriovoracaceae bacterium]|nr:hypothetical protein [Bacteriovoracaceae bacterium]
MKECIITRLLTIKLLSLFCLIVLSFNAYGGIYFQYQINYTSDTDDNTTETFAYSKMNNTVFIGAAFDKDGKFLIGQNVTIWNKSQQKGASDTADTISLMELGPRLQWFINAERNFYLAAVWNPYVSGTRVLGGTSETVTGSSMLFSFGYHLPLSKMFFVGGSLNYHMVSITEATVGTTTTTVADSYTSIVPMLEMSIRF